MSDSRSHDLRAAAPIVVAVAGEEMARAPPATSAPPPLYGQQASATAASDLVSCSHDAGGQSASEDILTVRTRSPMGDQDAPRHHAPADEASSELTFTVFAGHTTWLLVSVPMLQRLNPATDAEFQNRIILHDNTLNLPVVAQQPFLTSES